MAQPPQSEPEIPTAEPPDSEPKRVLRLVCGWNEKTNTFLYRDEVVNPPPIYGDGPGKVPKQPKRGSAKAKLSKDRKNIKSSPDAKPSNVSARAKEKIERLRRERADRRAKVSYEPFRPFDSYSNFVPRTPHHISSQVPHQLLRLKLATSLAGGEHRLSVSTPSLVTLMMTLMRFLQISNAMLCLTTYRALLDQCLSPKAAGRCRGQT